MTNEIRAAIITVAREVFGDHTSASYETLLADLTTRESEFNRLRDLLTIWSNQQDGETDVAVMPREIAEETEIRQGMYRNPRTEAIYKVQPSQAGRLYAKILDNGHFEYARGAIFEIKPNWRMTAEEISAYGVETGNCLICQRELTVPESVQRGIGPICFAKYC